MKLIDLLTGGADRGETTTGQCQEGVDRKTAKQAVNEERVFRNVPRQMKAGTSVKDDFKD